MSKIIDAFKMAWVGFAEEMKWDYSVRLSNGSSFSRKGIEIKAQGGLVRFNNGSRGFRLGKDRFKPGTVGHEIDKKIREKL